MKIEPGFNQNFHDSFAESLNFLNLQSQIYEMTNLMRQINEFESNPANKSVYPPPHVMPEYLYHPAGHGSFVRQSSQLAGPNASDAKKTQPQRIASIFGLAGDVNLANDSRLSLPG